jgi:hypothetical protein
MCCFRSKPKMQKTKFWKRMRPGPPRSDLLPTPTVEIQQMQLDSCLWDRDFDNMMTEMKRLEMWDYLSYVGKWQAMRTEMKLSMIRKGDREQIKRWTRLEKEGQVRENRKKVIHDHMAKDAEAVLKRAAEKRAAVKAWEDYRDREKAREDEKAKMKKVADERALKKKRAEALVKAQKLKEAEERKKEQARKRVEQAANKKAAVQAHKLAKRNCQLNVG